MVDRCVIYPGAFILLCVIPLTAAPGDNCQEPFTTLQIPQALPYHLIGGTTCGRVNEYSSTCLGSFDNGEDFILRLEVTAPTEVEIYLDPKQSGYTGIAIDSLCPPGNNCIAKSTQNAAGIHGINAVFLSPGTYYVMVDTWPTPICIPVFDLSIEQIMIDPWGIDCTIPFSDYIDSTRLPLQAGVFTTAGMVNDYSNTCLGSYDDGEDFVFQFEVRHPMTVDIELDPLGTAWSGMVLSTVCPAEATCSTQFFATDILGAPYSLQNIALNSGDYYLMVDSRVSIPSDLFFAVTISASPICGDPNADGVVNIADAVFLVAYIFNNGSAPGSLQTGDVNCTDIINVADAVYLIRYIFAGGPAPCAWCL